jgi:hypothetical protein
MTREELSKLYERFYFHEIEAREKLNARLQLPLAIIIAQLGVVVYIVRTVRSFEPSFFYLGLVISLIATMIALGFAVYYFVRSWFNYTYRFLPTARDIDDYTEQLEEYYKGLKDKDKSIQDDLSIFLNNAYIESSSHNTLNNDRRSAFLYKNTLSLIFSFVFSLLTMIFFFFGNLDAQKNAVQRVLVTAPIEIKNSSISEIQKQIKEAQMSSEKEKKETPPPPLPKLREVREGLEKSQKPTKKGVK